MMTNYKNFPEMIERTNSVETVKTLFCIAFLDKNINIRDFIKITDAIWRKLGTSFTDKWVYEINRLKYYSGNKYFIENEEY